MTITEAADPMTDPDPGIVGTRAGAGADDPVTGPMPAIDLHDGRIRVHVDKDVTIITLDGGLDVAFATAVAPTFVRVLADAGPVVLDVDQVALLDQAGFDVLSSAFASATAGHERCIVASRLSGRMVLERWGVTSVYAVFTSVADALQARAFQANGYGEGWQPEG